MMTTELHKNFPSETAQRHRASRILAKHRTLGIIASVILMGACSKDKLDGFPDGSPAVELCFDGSIVPDDGICPKAPVGSINGRICDDSTGMWLAGITVSVTTSDGVVVSDTTDVEGRYSLPNLPPDSYYVNFEGSDYANVLTTVVAEGQTAHLGPEVCEAPPGHLRGAVCDDITGAWVSGASVSLSDGEHTTVVTDESGGFMFLNVPAGTYVLTITYANGEEATRSATVIADEIADVGPAECRGAGGTVTGRICGGDGIWLSGASISVDLGGGALAETTTTGDGHFTLAGLPSGTHTVLVTKGAFSTTFEVTVINEQAVTLPDPVCIPPTASLAVVTGDYDKVEDVLQNLGYVVHNRYDSITPTLIDGQGTLDLIKGNNSDFWMESFLSDPLWMAEYDIIFLNCGLDDSLLSSGTGTEQALENLRQFVADGGSIYASDWASDTIRLTFPGRIEFFGGSGFGASRTGKANINQSAWVTDMPLSASLGSVTVTLNLDLPYWAVLKTAALQPADLRILVKGDIDYYTDPFGFSSNDISDSPLIVQFGHGRGRVLFTSAHNEGQNTPDLQNILNNIVFEL